MITMYHNTRCSTSRKGLKILEDSGKKFTVIEYLKTPLTKEQLKELAAKLHVKPIEMVRTKEAIWKENYKGKELTDDQVLAAIAEHPKLLERPIVVNGAKAVIGRPPEKIKEII